MAYNNKKESMERIYRLTLNQDELTEAESKADNDEVNHLEFMEFKDDYEELTEKPMFELSSNSFLLVSNQEELGRLMAFMLQGGVKTTSVKDVTMDMFYNKIETEGANDTFVEAVKYCLLNVFGEDDVFEKMKKLGWGEFLTETDKLIIEKSSLR